MPAPPTRAFARGTIGRGDYPVVCTVQRHVTRKRGLILARGHDASIGPILRRLERHIQFLGKLPHRHSLIVQPALQIQHVGILLPPSESRTRLSMRL